MDLRAYFTNDIPAVLEAYWVFSILSSCIFLLYVTAIVCFRGGKMDVEMESDIQMPKICTSIACTAHGAEK